MYGRLLKRVAHKVFSRLGEGATRFATALLAEDPRFRFPGRHPFAPGRPRFETQDVSASGPPGNIRAVVHFTDRIGASDDPNPDVNEGVCFMRMRWGRVVEERVFLDTQAVAECFGTESAEEFFVDLPAEAPSQATTDDEAPGACVLCHATKWARAT